MKFELFFLVLSIILYNNNNNVNGHSFSICPNSVDHLHVSDLSFKPDPPRSNEKLTIKLTVNPDTEITQGNAIIIINMLGVKVGEYSLDVCAYTKCPIVSNKETSLSFSSILPSGIPEHIEATVEFSIIDTISNHPITCIVTKVKTFDNILLSSTEIEQQQKQQNNNNNKPSLKGTLQNNNNNKLINENSIEFMFKLWLQQYHKIANIDEWYPIKVDDNEITKQKKQKMYGIKLLIFTENLIRIIAHNRKYQNGEVTYTMALNHFAHLKNEEFAKLYLSGYKADLKKPMNKNKNLVTNFFDLFSSKVNNIIRIPQEVFKADSGIIENDKKISDLPESFDWVEKGAVSPVKNQGSCGSCWAFSAIQALESAYFIKYGEMKIFSEQQLVSCDESCYGCGGGLMDLAFEWISRNGGICSETDYPYVSGNSGASGYCKSTTCQVDPKTAIQSFVDVEHTEEALMNALVQQPVSVAIEADQYAFQFYSGGVLTADCGDHLDHGVLVTGYGTMDNIPYWKLKNSWGANWGAQGYIFIERGKQVPNGDEECGILANPSYPVL